MNDSLQSYCRMPPTAFLVLFLAISSGCDSRSVPAPSERTSSRGSQAATLAPSPLVMTVPDPPSPGTIAGFRHPLSNSLFALGTATPAIEDQFGIRRHSGPKGVFVEWVNGFSAGIPSAGEAIDAVPPFSVRSAEHNARVAAYFRGRGLPLDQIGESDLTTTMLRTGSTNGPEDHFRLVGFTTCLRRVVDGVVVADSHAWARFNANDEVVAEQVWWPDLPSSVHEAIASFRRVLVDQDAASAFRAGFPSEVSGEDGVLAIHHSPPMGEKWRVAVTLDFSKRGRPYTVSVDASGRQLVFADAIQAGSVGKGVTNAANQDGGVP